ncbi:hypothetical protein [Tessaracoccus rhinocerotis]|uniref:hypothetical protein n=1 Tax=Tessaracoccus rhinocerotis TaxID=1689449 RepID=UPI00163D4956|nr:hypothetical protein [Tessaracoccus rhinocerotis]
MAEVEVKALLAAAKQDAEAARQISRWAETLRVAHEARTRLAELDPEDLQNALRRRP